MSESQINTYGDLKNEFLAVKKRIIKRQLTTNEDKLEEYTRDIISTHDNIVEFVASFYGTLDTDWKTYFRDQLIYIRDKTIECFGKLNSRHTVSTNLLEKVQVQEEESDYSGETTSDSEDEDPIKSISENYFEETETETMSNPLSVTDFLRLAAQTINRNFSGDPLALNSFINSVKLLQQVAGEHGDLLRQFVITKLEGRALEAIPEGESDINAILNALKAAIKPDSSKVIEGRMLALRVDRSKVQEFTKQAEELAEALERSLIVEGISQNKAKSMSIDKTVEMCRQSAKSDLVKSVLAATTFTNPKEVVAKFVVEAAIETKEKQILAFKAQQKRGNNNRGRGYGRNNQNGWRNQNGYNNNNNYNRNGYNGNNNYRGRGQGRGRGGRRNNDNYRNDYQERYVRVAENAGGPPQGWRVDQNQPQQRQQSQQPMSFIPYQRN